MISVSKLAMAAITAAGMAGSALADTAIVVSVKERALCRFFKLKAELD